MGVNQRQVVAFFWFDCSPDYNPDHISHNRCAGVSRLCVSRRRVIFTLRGNWELLKPRKDAKKDEGKEGASSSSAAGPLA